jgi:hypothetical protein
MRSRRFESRDGGRSPGRCDGADEGSGCESRPGGRQRCPANTAAGGALVKSTGSPLGGEEGLRRGVVSTTASWLFVPPA